jgi:hypothetical protein
MFFYNDRWTANDKNFHVNHSQLFRACSVHLANIHIKTLDTKSPHPMATSSNSGVSK